MPENFASLLEALNSEGRELARPVPAGAIEALGRGRRRRRVFSAAGSVILVCAVAAGVGLGTGGAKDSPTPTQPVSTRPAPSVPSSASTPHTALPSKNRTGTSALLLASEAPKPALYQWKITRTAPELTADFTDPICDFVPSNVQEPKTHAQSAVEADYTSAYDSTTAWESVYHYSSAAAAKQDYDILKPTTANCKRSIVVGTIADGFAWKDSADGADLHRMMVLSGSDIAYWFYQSAPGAVYDTSDDQAALQRMADRLDGGTPAPDPVTAPPSNTLPGSAWLGLSEIPFETADQSHGWLQMGSQETGPGAAPSSKLCQDADYAILNGPDAAIASRPYHGTPPGPPPLYQGSNYLYSSATQNIFTFPSADRAMAAFQYARQATGQQGCTFENGAGQKDVRTIKVGTATADGFSLLITDTPSPSYAHVYFVVKGTHVTQLTVTFEKGDTSTGGDAAVLAALAGHLP
ncbi:hypothetical protein Caci_2062 [Catenulispora acidiphila DSM 44928]|uniref:Uncharacterized protein n=1 Tax=Catenulispora acidiphila (strain DSM 44928 / JCM 14897 / NBRC 102108 / NRRL B-24433 / ID139908) TaxID=479433 RepID=C7QG04_CATAD|nr:hypothetical protein [Catenulispora acidiphila]ACU70981.1 hypothetical protein Caci_2062 [Catenulispora acidiphila DSM 44928]